MILQIPRFHILTFGCQMNHTDSERMAAVLFGAGLARSERPEDADVIVLNSCSVRQSAEDRVFGMAHNFFKFRQNNPELVIALTGCMVGRDKDGKIRKRLSGVDLFVNLKEMSELPRLLSELRPDWPIRVSNPCDYLSIFPKNNEKFRAFVPIQTGCDQWCSYCVVPSSRGRETNRPLGQILDECRRHAEDGCLELTLLGQIINRYRAPDPEFFSAKNPYKTNDFAKLLWEVNQLEGVKRINWTAPHPLYMDDEVADALTLPKQINFLHLPAQSGCDSVLKRMNRKYTKAEYLEALSRALAKRPELAKGTDIIVGFCEETEKEFEETLDFYRQCDFDLAFISQYSSRSGTLAEKMYQDNVSHEEKERRWSVMQDILRAVSLRKHQFFVGKTVEVLVNGKDKNGFFVGTTSEMKLVRFKSDLDLMGKLADVKIVSAREWEMAGEA